MDDIGNLIFFWYVIFPTLVLALGLALSLAQDLVLRSAGGPQARGVRAVNPRQASCWPVPSWRNRS